MRISAFRLLLSFVPVCLIIVAMNALAPSSIEAQTAKPKPCTAAIYRQFDFWLGDWDGFEWTDQKTVEARVHVDPMLEGCAVREVYDQNDGLHGESVTSYDAVRQSWHHSWVTNYGQLLELDGKKDGDRIFMTGVDHRADGTIRLVRDTWVPVEGGVRETAEFSTDNGKTWKPLFDMVFRPHKG